MGLSSLHTGLTYPVLSTKNLPWKPLTSPSASAAAPHCSPSSHQVCAMADESVQSLGPGPVSHTSPWETAAYLLPPGQLLFLWDPLGSWFVVTDMGPASC